MQVKSHAAEADVDLPDTVNLQQIVQYLSN